MVKIILFILIFCVIVIAHEFGHFLVAKVNGIDVVEFSIGMGPKIASFKKRETLYTIRLLPIGGACIFDQGDALEEMDKAEKEKIDEMTEKSLAENPDKSGAFGDASLFARFSTVLAGPLFNFILAFLLSLIVVSMTGVDDPVINSVMEGYPAEAAGLRAGDELVSLNGEHVHLYREVSLFSQMNDDGSPVEVVYLRDGEKYETVIIPKFDENDNRYYMGFTGGAYEKGNALSVIKGSFYEVKYWIKLTVKSIIMLFSGKASVNDLAGPVGVAQMVGEVYEEASVYGIITIVASMLNLAVLLSANLGIMNLLPIPALDGGRLLFLIIELIFRKPVPKDKEAIVNFIGFVLLMILMVVVCYNDIMRLFR